MIRIRSKLGRSQAAVLVAGACLALFANASGQPMIVFPPDAAEPVQLAAKELRRYIYLRTDALLEIHEKDAAPQGDDVILIAPENYPMVQALRGAIGGRAPEGGFLIKSVETQGRSALVIAGADPVSTLYGAYRFAERLGVSSGLALDVIPDRQIELEISGFDEAGKPLVKHRGILPFHDFPQGPDFWDLQDYMKIISQLPKLGMNFIGFHTYPRWSTVEEKEFEEPQGPEPAVWIGLPGDVNEDGTVSWAYPAYWAHTKRPDHIWGFTAVDTDRFHAGATRLFDRDGYGSDVFKNGRMPNDVKSSQGVFNRVGKMFRQAFTHARKLGVKTAVGTELPMGLEPQGPEVQKDWVRGMPPELQERLMAMGKNPADPDVVKEVYKGVFKRIMKAHPLDYYWLWSWEIWSKYGVSQQQIKAYERDIRMVRQALKEVGAPFQLAHAGWILGTADNPAEFEDVFPPEAPFYGLWDEALGFEELSEERVKWTATWFEEDWGLAQPQFELNRIYKDIQAGLEKGSDGVIAKHWRTRVLSMNAGAMKDLLWNYGPVGSDISNALPADMNEWIKAFYRKWARKRFGPEAASSIAAIFYRLDLAGKEIGGEYPAPLGWDAHGDFSAAPGAIMPNENDWEAEKQNYEFVEKFAGLRPRIRGAGNLARFDYWLNTFKAFRAIGNYGTLRHDFREAFEGREDVPAALRKRAEMARLWEDLITLEIQRVTNQSELGEIVNLETLSWRQLMARQWDEEIKDRSGRPIPSEANPSTDYQGSALIRVMPDRTRLYHGEPLELRAIAMGAPIEVKLYWRPLGDTEFNTASCPHIARGVYRAHLPPQSQDFEFYVQARTQQETVTYPASAPELNRAIVVCGRKSN